MNHKSKSVAGQGHGGAIVGQDGNYSYRSFGSGFSGGKGGYVEKPFNSLKVAMVFAKGQGYYRYARYPTSKKDDERARNRAKDWKSRGYHGTTSNCQDMVNDMMDATEKYRELAHLHSS